MKKLNELKIDGETVHVVLSVRSNQVRFSHNWDEEKHTATVFHAMESYPVILFNKYVGRKSGTAVLPKERMDEVIKIYDVYEEYMGIHDFEFSMYDTGESLIFVATLSITPHIDEEYAMHLDKDTGTLRYIDTNSPDARRARLYGYLVK